MISDTVVIVIVKSATASDSATTSDSASTSDRATTSSSSLYFM
jgi:hypothetical protein